MTKFNKRTRENVCKLMYLASEYPEHNIVELSRLFQTSPIDFNVTAWAAQDLGYLEVDKLNAVKILKFPKEEEFGELIEHLLEVIPYSLQKINQEEADVEDNYFGNWTAGYPAHDVMIAVRKLIKDKKIASYTVTNKTEMPLSKKQKGKGVKPEIVEDVYTFYTLPENLEKRWGEKQFEDPEKLER